MRNMSSITRIYFALSITLNELEKIISFFTGVQGIKTPGLGAFLLAALLFDIHAIHL
jgi:hypothetical protein